MGFSRGSVTRDIAAQCRLKWIGGHSSHRVREMFKRFARRKKQSFFITSFLWMLEDRLNFHTRYLIYDNM